jgi:RNA polymerase sigma-B factor
VIRQSAADPVVSSGGIAVGGRAGEEPSVSTSSEHSAAIDRDRLVESHLPLVRAIARRYAGRGEALDDLVQVGSIGLLRASKRFDPGRGVSFGTFVTPAIEGEIRRHLGERAAAVRIPRGLQRIAGELRGRRRQLAASLGREPSAEELAVELGVRREDIELALEAEQAREQLRESPELGTSSGHYAFPPSSDDRLAVIDGTRVLDERERRIVFLRFHADLTERDIARQLAISQGTVSRLLAGALEKLREELGDENLAGQRGDISDGRPAGGGEDGQAVQDLVQDRARSRPRRTARSRIAAVGGRRQTAEGRRAEAEAEPGVDRGKAEAGARPQQAGGTAPQPPSGKAGGASPKGSGPSGRFLVRMPSELHQELSQAAEREQVSLNRYVTQTLARSVSSGSEGGGAAAGGVPPAAGAATGGAPSAAVASRRRTFRMLVAANLVVIVVAAAAAVVLVVLALERGI